MPKVSVIITTYNRPQYLKQAIESILAQTYRDFEIIVVDDGSPMDIRPILAPYGAQVRYFRQKNRGIAAARNTGLSYAAGDYIAMLDDDDAWLPDRLATQVPILDGNPALGFVSAEVLVMDAEGKVYSHYRKPKGWNDTFGELYEGNYIHVPTVLLRKSHLLTLGGFDEGLSSTDDYDMWLRLAKTHPFIYLDRPLAIYRRYRGQFTKNPALFEMRIRNNLKVISKSELTHDLGFLRTLIRKAKVYHQYGNHYRMEGMFRQAGLNYCRAAITYPFVGTHYRPAAAPKTKLLTPYYVVKEYLLIFYCLLAALVRRPSGF